MDGSSWPLVGIQLSIAFRLTVVLTLLIPTSLLASPSLAQSCIGLGAAIALSCIAFGTRAVDIEPLWHSNFHLKIAALIPAAWIVLQLLPLPIGNASIWALADAALKRSAWGHGTIDIGQTSLALLSYLSLVVLTAVASILSLERERARVLLLAANISAVLVTTGLIATWLLAAFSVVPASPHHARDTLGGASIIALILSVSVMRLHSAGPSASITRARLMSVGAIVISLSGLAIAGRTSLIAIAAFGLGILAVIIVARRLGARRYAVWIALASLLAVTIVALAFGVESGHAMWPLKGAIATSPDHRALMDAGPLGTGAGTYQSVMPIYAPLGEMDPRPASTIMAFAIELGLPAIVLILAVAAVLIILLINGALARVRDSVFPLAAAACIACVAGEAFLDASLISYPALPAILAIVTGIGISQRLRRSNAARR